MAVGGTAAPATADGTGTNVLTLRVTVNTRSALGAVRPGIRVEGPVVKKYRLVNRGGADLYDVRLADPTLPGVRIVCPGGRARIAMLRGLSSASCTATGSARFGTRVGEVVATGRIPYLRAVVRATARSGYAGVGGGLALTESARFTGRSRATVRYTLTNRGNRPVYGVTLSDPALGPTRISCPGGRATVARLDPGRPARCTAVVRRGVGTYSSTGRAEGSDRLRTLGRWGNSVPPPKLTARASARFAIPRVAARRPPVPRREPAPREPAPREPEARNELDAPARRPAPPAGAGAPGVAPPGVPLPGVPPPLTGLLPPGAVAPPFDIAVPPPPAAPAEPAAPAVPAEPAVPAAPDEPAGPGTAQNVPRESAQEGQDPLPGRLYRPGGRPTGLGLLAMLFLLLLPAALVAAVVGSRRR
ncbi:hypothetical protein [Streptomyces sp. NPDC048442]|uniref:hypothetical protein n=1 Tax=Streptomyces sp. NPDC048442 TaxID=3154823 RepID=UPI0034337665